MKTVNSKKHCNTIPEQNIDCLNLRIGITFSNPPDFKRVYFYLQSPRTYVGIWFSPYLVNRFSDQLSTGICSQIGNGSTYDVDSWFHDVNYHDGSLLQWFDNSTSGVVSWFVWWNWPRCAECPGKKKNYQNNNTEVTGNLFDLNIQNMFEQKNIVTLQSVARNALWRTRHRKHTL